MHTNNLNARHLRNPSRSKLHGLAIALVSAGVLAFSPPPVSHASAPQQVIRDVHLAETFARLQRQSNHVFQGSATELADFIAEVLPHHEHYALNSTRLTIAMHVLKGNTPELLAFIEDCLKKGTTKDQSYIPYRVYGMAIEQTMAAQQDDMACALGDAMVAHLPVRYARKVRAATYVAAGRLPEAAQYLAELLDEEAIVFGWQYTYPERTGLPSAGIELDSVGVSGMWASPLGGCGMPFHQLGRQISLQDTNSNPVVEVLYDLPEVENWLDQAVRASMSGDSSALPESDALTSSKGGRYLRARMKLALLLEAEAPQAELDDALREVTQILSGENNDLHPVQSVLEVEVAMRRGDYERVETSLQGWVQTLDATRRGMNSRARYFALRELEAWNALFSINQRYLRYLPTSLALERLRTFGLSPTRTYTSVYRANRATMHAAHGLWLASRGEKLPSSTAAATSTSVNENDDEVDIDVDADEASPTNGFDRFTSGGNVHPVLRTHLPPPASLLEAEARFENAVRWSLYATGCQFALNYPLGTNYATQWFQQEFAPPLYYGFELDWSEADHMLDRDAAALLALAGDERHRMLQEKYASLMKLNDTGDSDPNESAELLELESRAWQALLPHMSAEEKLTFDSSKLPVAPPSLSPERVVETLAEAKSSEPMLELAWELVVNPWKEEAYSLPKAVQLPQREDFTWQVFSDLMLKLDSNWYPLHARHRASLALFAAWMVSPGSSLPEAFPLDEAARLACSEHLDALLRTADSPLGPVVMDGILDLLAAVAAGPAASASHQAAITNWCTQASRMLVEHELTSIHEGYLTTMYGGHTSREQLGFPQRFLNHVDKDSEAWRRFMVVLASPAYQPSMAARLTNEGVNDAVWKRHCAGQAQESDLRHLLLAKPLGSDLSTLSPVQYGSRTITSSSVYVKGMCELSHLGAPSDTLAWVNWDLGRRDEAKKHQRGALRFDACAPSLRHAYRVFCTSPTTEEVHPNLPTGE